MSNFPELIELLSLDVPEPLPRHVGFLEIAGREEKEVTISKVYQHFLDSSTSPEISGIFIKAIKELCEISFKVDAVKAYTEYPATGQQRIDILLHDESNDTYIIIENKIYHTLDDNDLLNYWNSIPAPAHHKMGVILTLEPLSDPDEWKPYYTNITHSQWIDKVNEIGLPLITDSKQYIYLQDFMNTIKQITKTYDMNDQASFYFRHARKLYRAIQTKSEAQRFVNAQLDIVRASDKFKYWQDRTSLPRIYFSSIEKMFCEIHIEPLIQGEGHVKLRFIIYGEEHIKSRLRGYLPQIQYDLEQHGLRPVMKAENTWSYTVAESNHDVAIGTEGAKDNSIDNLGEYLIQLIERKYVPIIKKLQELDKGA